ncbi:MULTISPECIES: motility associated factor glycosyltransferase family protein [Clostridium]|uniref:Motility associated factor glycosyltransferase family protein n=1 Tax=Clostridium lapidicellarium TaxID=3240931 RepID=A0ABV4DXM6_9CLOT
MNSITENTVDLVNNYNLSSSQANCKIEISKDNKKIIRVCKNGKWIYLGSKYNVTRDINNILNKIKDTDSKTLIVIFGLASGEYINELVKYIKEDNKVLIVEPSIEIIKLFLKENDRNLLEDERIYLVNFSKKLRDLLSGIIKIENLYDMVPIIYPVYDRIFSNECIEFLKYLNSARNDLMIEFNTTLAISKNIFYSTIRNIRSISNSLPVNKFKNKFKGMSAIVVSAGPSLEKNIDYLKKIQDDFIIISGLRNLKGLLKIGIVPDFLCILDTLDINYRFIEGCTNINIPIVFHEASSYKVIDKYTGPKILFLRNPKFSEFLGKQVDGLYQGGSVAHICTSFAVYIGCSTIIFVGQDLAYTNDKFHAKSASFEDEVEVHEDEKKYDLVDDIYGNKIKTDSVFNMFREKLEDFIKHNKNIKFINSTEGGADIKGTSVMSLKKSASMYGIKGKRAILSNTKDLYKNEFDKLKLKESILKNKKDLENIRSYIDKNEQNINKFQLYYNGATSLNINKIMNNLDKLDKFIEKSCSEFVLINDLLAPITLEAMYRRDLSVYSEDSDKDKGRKIAKKYKILYSNIKNGIDLAVPLFENAANGLD